MGALFQRDGKWGIDYTDHGGRRVRRMVAHDKSVAQKVLGDALSAVEKMKAGMTHSDQRETKKRIHVHIDAYVGDLGRRGRDRMYIYTCRRHIENAVKRRRWATLIACTPREVSAYLRQLADENLAGKTINTHRADLAAFFGWCVRNRLMEGNPCDQVPKSKVSTEKRRRALSVAECRALLDAAPKGRRVVYQFLMLTGLRRAEAGALTWSHLHLDVANPYVELPASITKSGQSEAVPLVPELADALRRHRRRADDADPVFESIPSMPLFRKDLAKAHIPEVDARGRIVVLHSLRHSLATMLAISNVPMAIAQRIMRHRDIRLTAEVYLDEGLLPLAAAMHALPALTGAAQTPRPLAVAQ